MYTPPGLSYQMGLITGKRSDGLIKVAVGKRGQDGKIRLTDFALLRKDEVSAWFNKRRGMDQFICPSVRDHGRKGGAKYGYLVWADCDARPAIPAGLLPYILKVGSGGTARFHLYIPMSKAVCWKDLTVLNYLLMMALRAEGTAKVDPKYTDECYLRVWGSRNYKWDRLVIVTEYPQLGSISPRALYKLLKKYAGAESLSDLRSRLTGTGRAQGLNGPQRLTEAARTAICRKLRKAGEGQAAVNIRNNDLPGFIPGSEGEGNGRGRKLHGFWSDLHRAGLTVNEAIALSLDFEPARDKYLSDDRIAKEVRRSYDKF